MSLTIGVDIGGTKVLGGVVDDDGKVIDTARRDTPAEDTTETLDRIVEVIKELGAAHDVDAVGIGAAGWIDAKRATVLYAAHLAWRDEPLRDEIAAKIDYPVIVENDANAAAWAEFRFGAARDADESMVMLTVGTGIGTGIIMGGEVVRGAHGIAAEIGHALAVRDGHLCGCGARGCLEQYASGNALTRFARAAIEASPDDGKRLLELADGDPRTINGPMVTKAAQEGDKIAIDSFNQVGAWLGIGLSDVVQILDPQVLVIGGGVIEAGELLLAPARAAFAERLPSRAKLPVAMIVGASMGNTAGVVGAADLARHS